MEFQLGFWSEFIESTQNISILYVTDEETFHLIFNGNNNCAFINDSARDDQKEI
jgi:hypothetical protein